MAKSRALLAFALLISLCVISSVSAGHGGKVGGRTEMEDVRKNKQVQELGRFSVKEFNRRQQQQGRLRGIINNVYGELMFREVKEAETQVVSGIKYYMKVEVATKSGERKMFDSVVVVKPWIHSKELLNFAPCHNY